MLAALVALMLTQPRPVLVGTLVAPDPRDSFAVVWVDSDYRAWKNGDRVSELDDARVVAIDPTQVALSRRGKRRWLVKTSACPSLVELGLTGNGCDIRTGARIVPSFRDGRALGFKLFSIRPDGIYARFGLKNGDVIRRINGWDITSPDRALQIYQQMKDASSLTVELERGGEPISISCSLPAR